MAILALVIAACIFISYFACSRSAHRPKATERSRGNLLHEKTAPTAPQLVLPADASQEDGSMTEKQEEVADILTSQSDAKVIASGSAETKPIKEATSATKEVTGFGTMQNGTPQKELDQKLMPPPAKPVAPKPRAPTASQGLRGPSNGPLPNRLPPAKSSLSGGSSLSVASVSTLPPNKRSSKKVQLSPGHSPLDWADKTRSENLSGVPFLQRITPSQLKTQTGRKGKPAWSSYKGRVYNIGPYLPFHPGGEDQLMKAAGRDGAKLFEEIHPWVNWDNMMESCLVGFLVPEETTGEDLDGLD